MQGEEGLPLGSVWGVRDPAAGASLVGWGRWGGEVGSACGVVGLQMVGGGACSGRRVAYYRICACA